MVAAGLVPLALASDAGGSVRIPAAHCGVVGLMPSVHRVPRQSAISVSSCVSYGVIAGTAADCALMYAVIARGGSDGAGEGPRPVSLVFGDLGPTPTPLRLPRFAGPGGTLAGLRVGVYRSWFNDCDPEVQASTQAGLDCMQSLGTARSVLLCCCAIMQRLCGAHVGHRRPPRPPAAERACASAPVALPAEAEELPTAAAHER